MSFFYFQKRLSKTQLAEKDEAVPDQVWDDIFFWLESPPHPPDKWRVNSGE